MQLPRGRRRPIQQSSRPEGPLVYARLSDPILVKRAKDGDPRALEALCERHAPRVEKLAARILRDPEDARDAAQEALAKLCTKIGQFRGEAQFATWLHRLTANACSDVANRQRARACEPLARGPSCRKRRRPCARSGPRRAPQRAEPLSRRDHTRSRPASSCSRMRSACRSKRSPPRPRCRSARRSAMRTAVATACARSFRTSHESFAEESP